MADSRTRIAGTLLLALAIGLVALVPFAADQALGITATPSRTLTPTFTPKPPTLTPTPLYHPLGDANCDNEVTSSDAAIILQLVSRLLGTTPCPLRADADRDGRIASVDAALILQYTSGLLDSLGDPSPTHTPTAAFGAQFSIAGGGCNTNGGSTLCTYDGELGTFAIYVSLNGYPDELDGYRSVRLTLDIGTIGSLENSPVQWLWPDCATSSTAVTSSTATLSCTMDESADQLSTYTGPMASIQVHSACDINAAIRHGREYTAIGDGDPERPTAYAETTGGTESIRIHCLFNDPPTPTRTVTPRPTGTPTSTATVTPCPPNGCPTTTPTRTPTPPNLGAQFSISADVDGDGADDCSTRAGAGVSCVALPGDSFLVRLNLDGLPTELREPGPGYDGFDLAVGYSGVEPVGDLDPHAWPDCVFAANATKVNSIHAACAIGLGENQPLPSSHYTGNIATAAFICINDGSISLVHGHGQTAILDSDLAEYYEAASGEESLLVLCGSP